MPRLFTLAQLRQRLRELTDTETSRHFTDTELNSRLSASYAKYHAKLVRAGLGYFTEVPVQFTSAGGANITLPADFFAFLRVDYQLNVETWDPLEEVPIQEIHRYLPSAARAFGYRLTGPLALTFYPTPPSGQVYRYIYIQNAADLTTDGQTVDGVAGWEEAILFDAALKALMKENEGDAPPLIVAERNALDARIDEEAEMRNLATNRRVARVRSDRPDRDPADYWPYYDGG